VTDPVADLLPRLAADCSACQGLCCVALPFDAAQGFGFDKPAHQACRHLQADERCAIHARLAESGFPGCVQFDCEGAGQRVTRLFGAQRWRDSAAQASELFEAFFLLRQAHAQLGLLATAWRLAPAGSLAERLAGQLQRLDAWCERVAQPGPGAKAVEWAGLRQQGQALLAEFGQGWPGAPAGVEVRR